MILFCFMLEFESIHLWSGIFAPRLYPFLIKEPAFALTDSNHLLASFFFFHYISSLIHSNYKLATSYFKWRKRVNIDMAHVFSLDFLSKKYLKKFQTNSTWVLSSDYVGYFKQKLWQKIIVSLFNMEYHLIKGKYCLQFWK